jgi:hypothetical protein
MKKIQVNFWINVYLLFKFLGNSIDKNYASGFQVTLSIRIYTLTSKKPSMESHFFLFFLSDALLLSNDTTTTTTNNNNNKRQ